MIPRNLWQPEATCIYACVPIANLLILLAFVVRDQEVGGSNPLAPTIPHKFHPLTGSTRLYAINGGTTVPDGLKNTLSSLSTDNC